MPFKLGKGRKDQPDDGLKDWKPMKIAETLQLKKQELQKEKANIAENFLFSLPKPKKEEQKEAKLAFDEKLLLRPREKGGKKAELTEEQIKWDVEDQTFIKKEFEQQGKGAIEHELVEDE